MQGPKPEAKCCAQDEEAEQLVTAMLEANALELLVQRMVHFNDRKEDDEATAVFSALNVLENLVEIKGEVRTAN